MGPTNGARVVLAAVIAAGAVAAALPRSARAQTERAPSVQLQVESRELYAELPFVLSVAAQGFDEEPEPTVSPLDIPGCKITYVGMTPNTRSVVQIVNGRRSEFRDVTFVFQYRVEAPAPGTYEIGAITVTQGDKQAATRPATFQTRAVPATADMRLAMVVPDRPVWTGETFDLRLEWYLSRKVEDQTFVIPLFDESDALELVPAPTPPGGSPDQVHPFSAGASEIALPYVRESITEGRQVYTKFTFFARATPTRAGTIDLPAPRVLAKLQVGRGTDRFGFPTAQVRLYKAEGAPTRLEVKPLPLANRPKSFSNAVGTAFSLDVQASRTVVRVGDPVELKVTVRGNGALDGLILPDLTADGGLSPELFSIPDTPPTGELLDDGKAKLFRVTVRLESDQATEIPPLALSYFDPVTSEYHTVRSQPIALSVKGSSVVGAGSVVSAGPSAGNATADPAATATGPASLVGADLSLSAPDRTLRTVLSTDAARPWLLGLYLLPLALLGVRVAQLRLRRRHGALDDARTTHRALTGELARAGDAPARDAAPRVVAGLRQLARQLGVEPAADDMAFLRKLETEAFDPKAGAAPLPAADRDRARELAAGWLRDGKRAASARGRAGGSAAIALVVGMSALAPVRADAPATTLDSARTTYDSALAEQDRDRRAAGFARAEALYRELNDSYPNRPELLADWGNAALGARNVGAAALAYRRALHLDGDLSRAHRNLAWVRANLPEWTRPRDSNSAIDSLFFWHAALSVAQRHLAGAAAFALAVLLLAPWGGRRQRLRRRLALIPIAAWLALTASALLERDASRDAVVMASDTLRAADSLGAPAALEQPVPAGAEVTIRETRDQWTRIELADGTQGWLRASGVSRVAR